ncbi:MAG: hypothetical protein GXP55_19975 [Deltaproteobacteria bacterium]|nr:hypothetical protein [Deltaproteobacteria bacterium]
MFGIGIGEFAIIFLVLLLAVGPKSMPKLMRTVGKGMREFRKATRELRAQVGIDEMLDEVRGEVDFKDPLGIREMKLAGKDVSGIPAKGISALDIEQEQPPEGVDLKHARDEVTRRQKETLVLREQVGATGASLRKAEEQATLDAETESDAGAEAVEQAEVAVGDAAATDDETPDVTT